MLEIGNFTFYPNDYNEIERKTKEIPVPVSALIEIEEMLSIVKKLNCNSLEEYVSKSLDKIEARNEIILDLIRLVNSMFSMDACTQRVEDEFLVVNRKYLEKEFKRYIELKEFLNDKEFTDSLMGSDFGDVLIMRDLYLGVKS